MWYLLDQSSVQAKYSCSLGRNFSRVSLFFIKQIELWRVNNHTSVVFFLHLPRTPLFRHSACLHVFGFGNEYRVSLEPWRCIFDQSTWADQGETKQTPTWYRSWVCWCRGKHSASVDLWGIEHRKPKCLIIYMYLTNGGHSRRYGQHPREY